jgi:hypothetical protein
VSDESPSVILVIGYLIYIIGSSAALWYLFLWLSSCEHCAGIPLAYLYILGFSFFFLFAAYSLIRLLFPARKRSSPVPH